MTSPAFILRAAQKIELTLSQSELDRRVAAERLNAAVRNCDDYKRRAEIAAKTLNQRIVRKKGKR